MVKYLLNSIHFKYHRQHIHQESVTVLKSFGTEALPLVDGADYYRYVNIYGVRTVLVHTETGFWSGGLLGGDIADTTPRRGKILRN